MHYTCDHSLFVLQKNRKQVRAHEENGGRRGAQHKNVLMSLTPDTRIDFLFLNLDATRLSLLHAWNRALTALCLVTHTSCVILIAAYLKSRYAWTRSVGFSLSVCICVYVHACSCMQGALLHRNVHACMERTGDNLKLYHSSGGIYLVFIGQSHSESETH